MIPGDTAEQAQAQLLQIVKRVAQQQTPPLEVGQVELGRPRTFGSAYGQVSLSITVTCRIEELVNFLAALSAQPELTATEEIRFGTSHPKQKTMPIRLTISGLGGPAPGAGAERVDRVLSGKLRLLDLALLVLAGLLYWQLRGEWIASHARDLALAQELAPGRSCSGPCASR